MDVIRRGSRLYERLVIGVGVNPGEAAAVHARRAARGPFAARGSVFRQCGSAFVRRTDGTFSSAEAGARVLLRGLRTLSDMEYEFIMSLTNQHLDPENRNRLSDGPSRTFALQRLADSADRLVRRRPGPVPSVRGAGGHARAADSSNSASRLGTAHLRGAYAMGTAGRRSGPV